MFMLLEIKTNRVVFEGSEEQLTSYLFTSRIILDGKENLYYTIEIP